MTNPAFRFTEETAQGLRNLAADLKIAAEVKAAQQNPHADLITAKLDTAGIWARRKAVGGAAARMVIKGDDQ